MRINWLIGVGRQRATGFDMKSVAPLWGSWRTWEEYQTDNCICSNLEEAQELLSHSFNNRCNLYLPKSFEMDGKNVKAFNGILQNDDFISMSLAVTFSDLLLVYGVDASNDIVLEIIKQNPKTQFVFIDYEGDFKKSYDNMFSDTMSAVQQMTIT